MDALFFSGNCVNSQRPDGAALFLRSTCDRARSGRVRLCLVLSIVLGTVEFGIRGERVIDFDIRKKSYGSKEIAIR